MKTSLKLICFTLLALALSACSGCASTAGNAVLQNLQGCERHYLGTVNAGITGGGFDGSVKIDCPARPQTGEPQATAAPQGPLAP